MQSLKNLLLAGWILATFVVSAQEKKEEEKGYQFTSVKEIPCTPVKDQYGSGTCWSFSGLGFLEPEMLRIEKQEVDLSEKIVLYQPYADKAVKDVRLHGSLQFGRVVAYLVVTHYINK